MSKQSSKIMSKQILSQTTFNLNSMCMLSSKSWLIQCVHVHLPKDTILWCKITEIKDWSRIYFSLNKSKMFYPDLLLTWDFSLSFELFYKEKFPLTIQCWLYYKYIIISSSKIINEKSGRIAHWQLFLTRRVNLKWVNT